MNQFYLFIYANKNKILFDDNVKIKIKEIVKN